MATTETAREKALANYRKKLLEHRELDARLKESMNILLLCFLILFKFKLLMLLGIAVDFSTDQIYFVMNGMHCEVIVTFSIFV